MTTSLRRGAKPANRDWPVQLELGQSADVRVVLASTTGAYTDIYYQKGPTDTAILSGMSFDCRTEATHSDSGSALGIAQLAGVVTEVVPMG